MTTFQFRRQTRTLIAWILVLSPFMSVVAFWTTSGPSGLWKSKQRLSRHSYANTIDSPPLSDQEAGNNLERQLRLELSYRQTQQEKRIIKSEQQLEKSARISRRPAFLRHVTTLMEYKRQVADEKERISVVRFISPYCRACKAATPAFDSLAHQFPNFNWVEVPVTQDNAALHQGLGVNTVPFGHIYVPEGGLVEELRMVRPEMQRFSRILQSYADGLCELPDDVNPATGIYEAPYQRDRA